jgi:RNA polymerase sigma-70 factor (ECF subfamily)
MSSVAVDWMKQLEALGQGDRVALAHLRRLITGHLIRLGAYDRRDSWDDLAQEVVIRLWQAYSKGKIRDPKAFVGYSRTITRNVFVDSIRRHHREDDAPIDDDFDQTIPSEEPRPDPGTQIALRKALASLPERHRQVIERIYLQGYSYEETARDLDRPRGTINRLQREAVQMLREVLLPPEEEESAI